MLTLNRFGLSNFRVFKEYTEFEFAPITVLTGTNNSGKSSLLKALLLIQDNAKRNGLKELEFDGGEHNLGSWDFTKNKFSDSEVMEFGIGFKKVYKKTKYNHIIDHWFLDKYIKEFTHNVSFGNKTIYNNPLPHSLSVRVQNQIIDNNAADFTKAILTLFAQEPKDEDDENYEDLVYGELKNTKLFQDGLPNIFNFNHFKKLFESKFHMLLEEFAKDVLNPAMWNYLRSHFALPINRWEEEEEKYEYFKNITIKDIITYKGVYNEAKYKSILTQINTNNYSIEKWKYHLAFSVRSARGIPMAEDYLLFRQARRVLDFFNDLSENFIYTNFYQKDLDNVEKTYHNILAYLNFEYLSVTRGKQERAYQHSKKDTALESLLVQFLKANYAKDSKAQVFINKWLKAFDLAEKVVFQPIMKDVYTSIVFYKNGLELNISDLGFGITQLLPLLMKIVMCEGKMLLLEEPETNLHPLLQSRLADLFIDAYKTFDIQFIIETHSEYFVRRLQVMTAKYEQAKRNQADTSAFISPDESVIYYFNNPENVPEGKKQVEKIKIMKDGRLDNGLGFGEGFLDEATKQKFELMQLTTIINEPEVVYQKKQG